MRHLLPADLHDSIPSREHDEPLFKKAGLGNHSNFWLI